MHQGGASFADTPMVSKAPGHREFLDDNLWRGSTLEGKNESFDERMISSKTPAQVTQNGMGGVGDLSLNWQP